MSQRGRAQDISWEVYCELMRIFFRQKTSRCQHRISKHTLNLNKWFEKEHFVPLDDTHTKNNTNIQRGWMYCVIMIQRHINSCFSLGLSLLLGGRTNMSANRSKLCSFMFNLLTVWHFFPWPTHFSHVSLLLHRSRSPQSQLLLDCWDSIGWVASSDDFSRSRREFPGLSVLYIRSSQPFCAL